MKQSSPFWKFHGVDVPRLRSMGDVKEEAGVPTLVMLGGCGTKVMSVLQLFPSLYASQASSRCPLIACSRHLPTYLYVYVLNRNLQLIRIHRSPHPHLRFQSSLPVLPNSLTQHPAHNTPMPNRTLNLMFLQQLRITSRQHLPLPFKLTPQNLVLREHIPSSKI